MEANKLDREIVGINLSNIWKEECFVCKTEAGKLHEYLDFYSDTRPKV